MVLLPADVKSKPVHEYVVRVLDRIASEAASRLIFTAQQPWKCKGFARRSG